MLFLGNKTINSPDELKLLAIDLLEECALKATKNYYSDDIEECELNSDYLQAFCSYNGEYYLFDLKFILEEELC